MEAPFSWRKDAQASLVVSLVALPLCLGIALASGAPLFSGLIAGIIGGIVVGIISGSKVSVSGPAAGLTVIIVNAIANLGSFESFCLAVVLSGIFQIIFGTIRAGKIGDYFPASVIKGMLAAIGIILILKQFPHAIGYDATFMGEESFSENSGENTFTSLLISMNWAHMGAVIISAISFLTIYIWDQAAKKSITFFQIFPGALAAVILAVILNQTFIIYFPDLGLDQTHLVQLPVGGSITSNLLFPNWSVIFEKKIWITAITIAIVGSLESLLSVEAADKIDDSGSITSKNRELIAQGVGNTLSGLIGGLPLTAVIVRTSANVAAGAKTRVSTILHGVWLLAFIMFIPQYLNLIPLSALAIVLILVGYKLTKPELFKLMASKGANQFIPFIVTIMAILFTDLLIGIMIGMGVGFVFVIKSSIHKSIVMVHEEENYLIRFYKDVSFLQKSQLISILSSIPEGSSLVIDGSKGVFIDSDIEECVIDFIKKSKSLDIKVQLEKSSLSLSNLFKEETHG